MPFQSQGSNLGGRAELREDGERYSASTVQPGTLLENTLTGDAYLVDDNSTPIFHSTRRRPAAGRRPDAGIIVQASTNITYDGGSTCTGRVQIGRVGAPVIEIAAVPSETDLRRLARPGRGHRA